MIHRLEACARLSTMFEFHDIRSAEPPAKKGLYLIRVKERGEPIAAIVHNVCVGNILASIGWPQVTRYVRDRINRLARIDDRPIIYVGSAAPGATSTNTLRGRYQEFANRHTAMCPIWALLSFGWQLEFGRLACADPREAEKKLKKQYKSLHDGHLPALVAR